MVQEREQNATPQPSPQTHLCSCWRRRLGLEKAARRPVAEALAAAGRSPAESCACATVLAIMLLHE